MRALKIVESSVCRSCIMYRGINILTCVAALERRFLGVVQIFSARLIPNLNKPRHGKQPRQRVPGPPPLQEVT
jgi:hypothetical protein